ncbi:hypothetical protein [Parapedobacter tibetensis]|uniref:hypothetical protein n=1 Tax=Parapedobacter tibetensis TaxID=2972951 RepID=UPI00214D8D78|nr:hypothetical protein [Parapedobacter tibetensis]
MNFKQQALGGFSNVPDNELLVQSNTVLQAMTDNTHYPAPVPDLAEVATACDDFSAKLAIARKRSGPEETSAKNDARLVLADLMKRLAFHVNTTARGNLTVLLSSGFRISAYPQQGRVPEQPFGGRLVRGRQSGQLVFSVQKVPGKLYYEYRYGTKAEGDAEPSVGGAIRDDLVRGQCNRSGNGDGALLCAGPCVQWLWQIGMERTGIMHRALTQG